MYVEHPRLTLSYDDSHKIWRYMDFAKFVSLISSRALYFCRADKFHDKWEGVFPIKMIQKFNLDAKQPLFINGQTYTHLEWQMQIEARSHWINCWHANEHESFAMWKIYSGDDRGAIAIQSTVGRLKRSIDINSERIWIGEVEYIDFREWKPENRFFNVDMPNTLKAFFLKWHHFKYENELRAIINKADSKLQSQSGIFVDTDINELIEHVYLSPVCDQHDENRVRDLLDKHDCSLQVKRSDLGVNLYM
ncbi:MAG: hypothetical protein HY868_00870 [Chloroflexi bacterium]|nr:hypothetical protein [Chloroflexota bacterium]